MNLFKFNLFKFCSNFVLNFEHVHEQFMKVRLVHEHLHKKKNFEKNLNMFMNHENVNFEKNLNMLFMKT
jgi:hypothetical protein